MLEINSDIVRSIIDRAHEFHAQEGVVFPELPGSPTDDWAMQVLANHADDLSFQELRGLIRDLEPDQQINLVVLMWLGRGDFMEDELEEALDQARDLWTPRTAEYLIATPLVADYLEEGLSLLGYSED